MKNSKQIAVKITVKTRAGKTVAPTPKGLNHTSPGLDRSVPRGPTLGKPAAKPHNPEGVASISDTNFTEIERLVTATIDELVFLKKNAEDNELDEAGDCSMTIGTNLGRIEEILAAAMEAT